jgi:thiol-disulfide isomerase/thioredoxin
MTTLFRRVHMPSLDGATAWLNSEPLDPAGLRGRVVLVEFWTLTCINWLRAEPYVRAWSRAYRDDGLVVIGVHTPEFAFEHDVDLVRQAVRERGIDHPVAVDNDHSVWRAFDNHYWPALYFVDRAGLLRDTHFGEGRYEQSERLLQRLLGIDREPVSVEGVGVEAAADWHSLRTPETYLGYERSERFASPGGAAYDEVATYELPGHLRAGQWALDGEWRTGPEDVALHGAPGSIAFRFSARDAHLVLSSGAGEPIPFRVRLDGEAPGRSHGVDVDGQGDGVLREGRMYQLVRQAGEVRERTVDISFREPGARAHVLTFG